MEQKSGNQSGEILSVEWKEKMQDGMKDALDNYELFGRINFSPDTLTEGYDDRTWSELEDEEREWVMKELFYGNQFDRQSDIVVNEYKFKAPKGEGVTWKGTASVKVYETHHSKLEDMYLHEITIPGKVVEYVIAPKDVEL